MSDGQRRTRYLVPAAMHRTEQTIRRSRFITTVARAHTAAAAKATIGLVRAEFADATHHCWAYVVGPPGSSRTVGMSDDGEPHGTAGKPMLNVLLHGSVGDIVAVCTRYFGGVKLGTGGLSRAYAGGVIDALDSLPTAFKQEFVTMILDVPYEYADSIRRVADQLGGVIDSVEYGCSIAFTISVPCDQREVFSTRVSEITRGRITPTTSLDS